MMPELICWNIFTVHSTFHAGAAVVWFDAAFKLLMTSAKKNNERWETKKRQNRHKLSFVQAEFRWRKSEWAFIINEVMECNKWHRFAVCAMLALSGLRCRSDGWSRVWINFRCQHLIYVRHTVHIILHYGGKLERAEKSVEKMSNQYAREMWCKNMQKGISSITDWQSATHEWTNWVCVGTGISYLNLLEILFNSLLICSLHTHLVSAFCLHTDGICNFTQFDFKKICIHVFWIRFFDLIPKSSVIHQIESNSQQIFFLKHLKNRFNLSISFFG